MMVLPHSGGGTWRPGFLSSMESISRGGRFKKGGRSGTGPLHRLEGVTNSGRRVAVPVAHLTCLQRFPFRNLLYSRLFCNSHRICGM